MNTHREHFDRSQQIERERILSLFDNYFRRNDCNRLTITSTDYPNSFDCFFLSGRSKNYKTVMLEFKKRDIQLCKYSDCLLEFVKFEPLYDFHRAGNHVLFAIEYTDYTAIWSLSQLYNSEQFVYDTYGLSYYFYTHQFSPNCSPSGYSRGGVDKLVRGLKFWDAQFFLDKEYNKLSYQQLLERYREESL